MESDTTLPTNWRLLDEVGIEAAPLASPAAPLSFPVFAAKSLDGTYLIGDELGTNKLVPFRFESRMIGVTAQGELVFDSSTLGIHDGFACFVDQGHLAILRRTTWELLIVSTQGYVTDCLPLWSYSKRMPRHVTWTDQATFLVVFCNRVGEVDIIEVDRQGRLLWYLPSHSTEIGIAGNVQRLPSGNLLTADPLRHVAVEIDRDGKIVWQFGVAGEPSAAEDRLSSPTSANALPDGRRLIADTRNHRVLLVSQNGESRPLKPVGTEFCDPMYASALSDGNFLVCDTGNRRVVEMDPAGHIVWQFGDAAPPRRSLSYPRSVELGGDRQYVIADTAHNRVVEIAAGKIGERPVLAQPPLFWPRCARPLPSGGLLIADGRNGRILEVAPEGAVLRELFEIDLGGREVLCDPHDVRMLPNGHLLIVDSSQDLVVEADWSGRVYRVIGDQEGLKLKDPHSAQQLADGSIVIADTGHHRVLFVGRDGRCFHQLDALHSDSNCLRLNYPRYVEISEDGTMVIADTGNNRVLAASMDGRLIWEFTHVAGVRPARLNQPRWAKLVSRNEVMICDHFHHRILHVACDRS